MKMNTLMKPKVDYAFKEIMMNEKARVGFLSAILNLNPLDIKQTQILNRANKIKTLNKKIINT